MIPRSEYPRPQFVRSSWINLNGPWTFEFDFSRSGMERNLQKSTGFSRIIQVPFCPESRLSGVGYTDFIPAMFYHRKITIPPGWTGKRILLHFGAVDYECEGFLDGNSVGKHYGTGSSFEFDLTEFARPGQAQDLVVRVKDDTRSGAQPLGKQSPRYASSGCVYTRTTGIWQTVWLEAVSEFGLRRCRITPALDESCFLCEPEFYRENDNLIFCVALSGDGQTVTAGTTCRNNRLMRLDLEKTRPWSPDDPFLYDLEFTIRDQNGVEVDHVDSYAGLRKIQVEGSRILLNNQPLYQRLVLDQGFYPDGIWTAPSDQDLKHDIELSMAAGFNGARLHQKVFEERFHYWADKLGYLTWGESASGGLACLGGNADLRDPHYWESVYNFQQEWREIVTRDYNHPSIITWTPLNETIGTGPVDSYKRILSDLYELTRLLDPMRPINDTSGFCHVRTDLWTVHYYCGDNENFKKKLADPEKPGSAGWDLAVRAEKRCGTRYGGQPFLIDEFGGFLFIPPEKRDSNQTDAWGYNQDVIESEDGLCSRIRAQVDLILEREDIAGYCYTQLTDVEQEQNGLYLYDRTPKASNVKLTMIFGRKPRSFQR